MSHPLISQLNETSAWLKNKITIAPAVGVVLGTGLSNLVKHIQVTESIAYNDIPHFPVSTVESHKGNLVFGHIGSVQVVAMQGRFHFYEGYTMQQVTFPIRIMKAFFKLIHSCSAIINCGITILNTRCEYEAMKHTFLLQIICHAGTSAHGPLDASLFR